MNYLIWLFVFIWIPTLILWFFNFQLLWKYRKTLLYAMFFALLFSIPWDILAVSNHIWFFPKGGNIGFWIGGIPFEEYLFIATVTLLAGSIMILIKYHKHGSGSVPHRESRYVTLPVCLRATIRGVLRLYE